MRSLLMAIIGLTVVGVAHGEVIEKLKFSAESLKVDSPKVGTYRTLHSIKMIDHVDFFQKIDDEASNRRAFLNAVQACFELNESADINNVVDSDYKAQNNHCVSLRQESYAREISLYAADMGVAIDEMNSILGGYGIGRQALTKMILVRKLDPARSSAFKSRALVDSLKSKLRRAKAAQMKHFYFNLGNFETLNRDTEMSTISREFRELTQPINGEYYRKMTREEVLEFQNQGNHEFFHEKDHK